MAVSYIFTKDEFVYIASYMSDNMKICDEQFLEWSPLYKCLRKGDRLESRIRRHDSELSLTEKGMLRFTGGKYAVEGVIYYLFQQMSTGALMTGNKSISKYECGEIDVYVYDDRNDPKKCCVYPCRKNCDEDTDELADMIDDLPEFAEYES